MVNVLQMKKCSKTYRKEWMASRKAWRTKKSRRIVRRIRERKEEEKELLELSEEKATVKTSSFKKKQSPKC